MPPVQTQPQPSPYQWGAVPPIAPIAPIAPVAQPTFDPSAFKQEVIDGVKQTIAPMLEHSSAPSDDDQQQEEPKKTYNEWGAVFEDVAKVVDQRIDHHNQQLTQTNTLAEQQEQQNQHYIDNTLNQLRGAGYLPVVSDQFNREDPGKQAENELLGYAVSMGTADLVSAAKELKFRHDSGFKFDYQTKQFVSNKPETAEEPSIFGNFSNSDNQPQPSQPVAPQPVGQPYYPQAQYPPQYPQPYGPQNPYILPTYPAGFNAPVASGGSYPGVGMQGQVPSIQTLRSMNNYDQIVDMFNRTQ